MFAEGGGGGVVAGERGGGTAACAYSIACVQGVCFLIRSIAVVTSRLFHCVCFVVCVSWHLE